MNFEINKELVASTAHLKQETSELLDEAAKDCMVLPEISVENTAYGHRIYVPRNLEDIKYFPAEMQPMIRIAMLLGCKWLLYDCDGPIYDEKLPDYILREPELSGLELGILPTWEW